MGKEEIGTLVNLQEFGRVVWQSGEKPEEIENHLLQPLQDEQEVFYWIPTSASKEEKPHIGVEWNEPRDIYYLLLPVILQYQ